MEGERNPEKEIYIEGKKKRFTMHHIVFSMNFCLMAHGAV